MSHEPPIPAGNQSPFPLQEPKHEAGRPPPGAAIARTPAPKPGLHPAIIGGLVAAGTVALAAFGAWAYASEPKNKRKGGKRRRKAR